MDEVARRRMRPRFVLVLDAERVPLVEDMRDAVLSDEAVRVVDEAEGHLEVEAVVIAVRERQALADLRIDGSTVEFAADVLRFHI